MINYIDGVLSTSFLRKNRHESIFVWSTIFSVIRRTTKLSGVWYRATPAFGFIFQGRIFAERVFTKELYLGNDLLERAYAE